MIKVFGKSKEKCINIPEKYDLISIKKWINIHSSAGRQTYAPVTFWQQHKTWFEIAEHDACF